MATKSDYVLVLEAAQAIKVGLKPVKRPVLPTSDVSDSAFLRLIKCL